MAADDRHVFGDDELDELVAQFVDRAVLAHQAGFDFVDVKACHGYLGHEFLTAHDRPGPYGGDFEGRTHFVRSVIEGIRALVPELGVAIRLSLFDLVPFVAGPGGTGVPEVEGPYGHAFGGDGTGLGIDLTETHRLLDVLTDLGVGLVCATAGSPYYVPHAQRPAFFPAVRRLSTAEDPLVGVARILAATAEVDPAPSDDADRGRGPVVPPGMAAQRRPGDGGHGRSRRRRPRPHDPLVPAHAGRRARRPPARPAVAVPHVLRLHHGTPQRPRVGLLPARRLLQRP
ncbi:MAG: hypothetical protein R2695_13960 [Acidimicrobiales bacterium]